MKTFSASLNCHKCLWELQTHQRYFATKKHLSVRSLDIVGHLCGAALPPRENKLLATRENHWQPSPLANGCVHVHTERFPISWDLLSCEERWLCFKKHWEGKTEFSIPNNNSAAQKGSEALMSWATRGTQNGKEAMIAMTFLSLGPKTQDYTALRYVYGLEHVTRKSTEEGVLEAAMMHKVKATSE